MGIGELLRQPPPLKNAGRKVFILFFRGGGTRDEGEFSWITFYDQLGRSWW